jgi:hypothetical protein
MGRLEEDTCEIWGGIKCLKSWDSNYTMNVKLLKSSADASCWQDRVRFRSENQIATFLNPPRIHIDSHIDGFFVEIEHTKDDVNLKRHLSRYQSHPFHLQLLASKVHAL